MAARIPIPAFALLESAHRPHFMPTPSAIVSTAVHVGLVAGVIFATAVAREYTEEEQLRAAQFLLPLRQEVARPMQERVTFTSLRGAMASLPASRPTITDRFVDKPADVQSPQVMAVEGAPELPQRAYSELEVDSTALRDPASDGPTYPAALLEQGIEGRALVHFVVTADGTVDLGTFSVIQSTDSLFTTAARKVLPRMKFRPAWFSGKPVSQLVEQEFTFRIRKPAS